MSRYATVYLVVTRSLYLLYLIKLFLTESVNAWTLVKSSHAGKEKLKVKRLRTIFRIFSLGRDKYFSFYRFKFVFTFT